MSSVQPLLIDLTRFAEVCDLVAARANLPYGPQYKLAIQTRAASLIASHVTSILFNPATCRS